MNETPEYDVTVVGGGPAGLTAALYTTRLSHDTAVINRGGGRAAMMMDTHNVLGITEDVSGNEFLQTAVEQLEGYGTDYFRDTVTAITATEDGPRRFLVEAGDVSVYTDYVVVATGFTDKRPEPPLPRTGRGLHYCLHCDAYMFVDEPVYVMGHSNSAAHVAMIMLNFTDRVDILLRGAEPTWSEKTDTLVRAHPVNIIEADIESKFPDEDDPSWLGGFEFEDGTRREYKGGFAMYGSEYNTALAESLGVDLNDDGTIAVDDHGKTNVEGVYAVGDVTPGHNQIPVALGEGAKAGISIHYSARTFPMSLDEIEELGGEIDAAHAPAISEKLRDAAVKHEAGEVVADDD
ncbi:MULTISPECIES: NAD(P)/FAD-dependent oxidoreductase [unclassified Haladaptatus]|uniref:NAD(P)/FAD-dependent oxidoreductase n=1 Tax=unclassified Haladaptatus TaxID=2622732 RepID=UPI0023E83ABF|nr:MULTISPECIES: NAD(P)/FAD-dependent oxidoreductase [unclassified Haladaptatus]